MTEHQATYMIDILERILYIAGKFESVMDAQHVAPQTPLSDVRIDKASIEAAIPVLENLVSNSPSQSNRDVYGLALANMKRALVGQP